MKIIKQYISTNKIKIPSMGRYLDNPGLTKYFPSFSREWKNIIYSYNKNIVRNIPMNYFTINKLIKNYFNLYFKNTHFIKAKLKLFLWRRRRLLNRIYVSDADIKYTNNKAIITLFTVSTKKNELIKKYLKINKKIRKNFVRHFIKTYKELPWQLNYLMNKKKNLSLANLSLNKKYLFIKEVFRKENFIQYRLQYLKTFTKLNYFYIKKIWMSIKIKYLTRKVGKLYWREKISSGEKTFTLYKNKYTDLYNNNTTKFLLRKILTGKTNKSKSTRQYLLLLRRYQLLYALNEYKFNKSKYLPILSNYLNKITGKKIEYNIINLKSIINSPDIFTNYMALRIQRSKQNIAISSLSNITSMPFIYKEQNTMLSKTPLDIFEKKDSLIQKFKNPRIFSNLQDLRKLETNANQQGKNISSFFKTEEKIIKNNLDNLLTQAYSNNENIYSTIYNNIKYKNISGIKLEIKGRLTKRYKAERAKHYTKFKGGLKNKDSSYRKQSTLLFRGNTNINSSYYLQKSKRRVGSFAIKGWISGK